ncbi:hypothetical protein TNCV_489511 [Trichonephila clavipes]|nr:hypothetical protein TNCV_489511 [Trichonephila clavipes]
MKTATFLLGNSTVYCLIQTSLSSCNSFEIPATWDIPRRCQEMLGRTVTQHGPVQHELSEILMYFVHNQVPIVYKRIQKIEDQPILATEVSL